MTVHWTPTALRDLESLHAYVAEDNPDAAAATIDKVVSGIEALQLHPDLGRKGRVAETGELIISPYIVVYRVMRAAIELVAIIHGARRWPTSF